MNNYKMVIKNRFKLIPSVHLMLEQEDKILLLLRDNTGYEDGKYSLVAGHADGKEAILQASIREAKEEAGINILEQDLKFGCVIHRYTETGERIDFFFLCNKWQGKIINTEPHKSLELKFFSKTNLPSNIVEYVVFGMNCSWSGIKFAQFGWNNLINQGVCSGSHL